MAFFIGGIHQTQAYQGIQRTAYRRTVSPGARHELALRHPVAPFVPVAISFPAHRLAHDDTQNAPLGVLKGWHYAVNQHAGERSIGREVVG